MGALSAMDAANTMDLRHALAWHLQSNHYPPIPTTMIEPCITAIDSCNAGDHDDQVPLPDGVYYQGSNYAPAWAIVEQHHLDFWITEED